MSLDVVFFMQEAVWPALLANAEGVIQQANPAARNFFGAALGSLPAPLSSLWPGDAATSWEDLLKQTSGDMLSMPRMQFRQPDGSQIERVLCGSKFTGTEPVVLIQFLPIPARDPTSSEAAAQKHKLECALQLARTVASDFNNVLTSILGHTSLVLSKLEPGHPLRTSLLEVEKSAAKAAEIANDLGTFSSSSREQKSPAAGNLNALLRRSVDTWREDDGQPPIHWSFHLEKHLFACKFDEAKIQQAVVKILENAAESLSGEGRITLSTRSLELAESTQDRNVHLNPGAYVCVEIKDSGSGIKPEVLPRVFEPFFTTKGAPHRGLGLAWVYGILTNHGGGVAISSQAGSGASVRLYLPAEKRHLKDAGNDSPTELAGTQKILLVDDEELLLSMGQTILSSFGYNVIVASNGQRALELLRASQPPIDLLITDLVMPGMTGTELARTTRQVSPYTRILCTSGFVSNSGHYDESNYLQKPFTTQELLLKIKQSLS